MPADGAPARPVGADRVFPLIAFPTIFALAARVGIQPDTWWMLRTGQEIVRTHRPVTTELWSSTARGDDWPNHETLSEIGFYLLHRSGGFPLLALTLATVVTASWYLIYRTCDGPARFRAVAVMLGAYVQSVNFGMRPFLLTMAFFAATVALLPHRRWHALYPVLFLVWANTHGGVSYGGLVLVVATIVSWWRVPADRWHWLRITALSGVATLLNPLGLDLWRLVLHTFDNDFLKLTGEWQPISLSDGHGVRIAVAIVVTAGALAATLRDRRSALDLTLLVCTALLLALSVRAYRHSAIAAPLIAVALARAVRDRPPAAPPDPGLRRLHAVAATAVFVLLALITIPWIVDDPARTPISAEIAAGIERCDGPLFTTFDNGGYLLWWLPDEPVFVDNRQDPYPQELLFASVDAVRGDYEVLFAEHRIRCAFVEVRAPLVARLLADGWRRTAIDDRFVVLDHGA